MTLDEAKAMLRFMIYNPVTEEEAEAIEVVLEALAEQEGLMQAIYVGSPYRGDIGKNTKCAAECC